MSVVVNYFADKLNDLTYAEKHIFYYIDSNLEKAKEQSLTKMAEENNVSNTTIVRMCSKLGLSGFSELKYILKNIDIPSTPNIYNYIGVIKNNINHSLDKLSIGNINKLVKMIKGSQKIIIVAVGLSKPMGEYFSKLLMQSNKSSFYIYESQIIDLLDKSSTHDDLIIFISNSGETHTLTTIAEKLSYRNFKTVAIVNTPDSTLSKLVDISINAYSEKNNLYGYDITARSTLLVIIDIIFAYYINNTKIT
ncbi:MurR/RpiR family transcriptional regulator [Clostridium sp. CM028]|uniref:MurR/RpiR family transcriptional regulator n=1 Tax=Clostridium sp. CM028 TaxID=2851575 RepID=UPI001C6E6DA6|nr:MurR/RpiR family transcriptional regulator [Clostridium sp. CM028]MBW9150043.1 MurR/RpiR family transcriptional regulator [Clostridium sp. CM028]WLC60558.1 MurR/RpiR family transcriptional regulator [Clostridium sp. CM028]